MEAKFGYKINNFSYLTTPFADDFNLITRNKRTHQRLINKLFEWSDSMGLKLKPSKCKSLSLVSGQPQSINFQMGDDILETLEEQPHKFLGSTITFCNKQSEIYQIVLEHFETRLKRIDNLLIRNEYKIKMYIDYLLPASKFILTVHNLTSTSLNKLDSVVTRYLKNWIGLPHSGTPAVIHAPQIFSVKSIKQLYQECQSNAYISSKMKADIKVINALDSRLKREQSWTRKKSTIVACDNIMQKVIESSEETNIKSLKKEAQKTINQEMQDHWFNHLKSLIVQGKFLTSDECMNDINYKSILFNLPRNVLKFLSNAAIDTLPTNVNLKRWNKRSSSSCNLCGNKETLLHVLNFCKVMLDQGRYTWRHNSILNYIHSTIKNTNQDSLEIFCDLPGILVGISTIPTDIIITSQRPDLVIVNRILKKVTLVELTVPFDLNVTRAHERKLDRYENLINDINDTDYTAAYLAIEVGSRGFISNDNNLRLKELFNMFGICSKKELNMLISNLKKAVIIASYCVFYSKYEKSWIDPKLISI